MRYIFLLAALAVSSSAYAEDSAKSTLLPNNAVSPSGVTAQQPQRTSETPKQLQEDRQRKLDLQRKKLAQNTAPKNAEEALTREKPRERILRRQQRIDQEKALAQEKKLDRAKTKQSGQSDADAMHDGHAKDQRKAMGHADSQEDARADRHSNDQAGQDSEPNGHGKHKGWDKKGKHKGTDKKQGHSD